MFPVNLEIVLQITFKHLEEPSPILFINQTVIEDTLSFVNPQADKCFFVLKIVVIYFEDALENFAQVSQVECIVRFSWSWQELSSNFTIHVK